MRRLLLRAVLFLLLLSSACAPPKATRAEVTVAAAANLTEVFGKLGPQFESQTGIHPVFSFGSTAQLTQQIENRAPFDVFTAADAEHVDKLEGEGLLDPASGAVYATGVLVLWSPKSNIDRLEDLASPAVHTIAIAKPQLAPYGEASVETLTGLGLWNKVEPKVVYAENINMARQYGLSGNADAVFTANSLVLREQGRKIEVDDSLHRPIVQKLGIVAQSKNQDAARKFADFLLHGRGHQLLLDSGYR